MVRILPATHSLRPFYLGKDVTAGKWQPPLQLRPRLSLPLIPHPGLRVGLGEAFLIVLVLGSKVGAFGLLDDV
jgi:hypothetical protein